jgi:hypothetical protein
MKDLLHNPVLYYIVITLIVGAWPLAVYVKYLPDMDQHLQTQKEIYTESESHIETILEKDPDRLSRTENQADGAKFDYATEIDEISKKFGILTPGFTASPSAKGEQTARVKLNNVNITQCTNFLSTLQIRWEALKYTNLSLNKKKGAKDKWDVTMNIVYFD